MKHLEKYLSVAEVAKKWGKTTRNIRSHCIKGHIAGAYVSGREWRIPADAKDPAHSTRRKKRIRTVLDILRDEAQSQMKGGLYHRLQIDFAFNSNHMEGSTLTHNQTKWIFETQTIGAINESVPVDDIIETRNHFRCLDSIIETAGARLTETYIKRLHAQLKGGTSDAFKHWFAVGDYKKLDNIVSNCETCPASEVSHQMKNLLCWYEKAEKSLETLVDFHVRFEKIHPFQDGNGRVGRLILLKECLKYNITPFVIAESLRQFYYLGLSEWTHNRHARLLDVCLTGQDIFTKQLAKYNQ